MAEGTGQAMEVAGRPRSTLLWLLRLGVAVPLFGAGIDKYLGRLADWEMYLAPDLALLGGSRHFLRTAGAIEVAIALVVVLFPRAGGWLAAIWLWAVILNLLIIPGFYDLALRDFGLSMAALALSKAAKRDGR